MSEYLYHYTSMESIFGMLQSYSKDNPYCTMWASNVLFMNDASEYQFGIDVCKELAMQYEGEEHIDDGFAHIYNSQFWHKKELDYPYIISFSERVDSAAIWNMYSNNGGGVAIIFNMEKLAVLEGTWLDKCWYCRVADNLLFNPNTRALITYLYNHCLNTPCPEERPEGINEQSFQNIMRAFHFQFEVAPKIKHASFDYEAEWRLTKTGAAKPKFRCKNGVIVPYKEVIIPINVIEGFIIGPTANFEYIQKSLRLYLSAIGLNDLAQNIKQSTVPYRG